MSLPFASTLRIDGHIKNLGMTSTARPDVLIHGQGIAQEPVVTDGGRDINLDVGGYRPEGGDEPRRLVLSHFVKWSLVFDGAGTQIRANLTGLDLESLKLDGAFANCSFDLPVPKRPVQITADGIMRGLNLRRPAGVPVVVYMDGPGHNVDLGTATLGDPLFGRGKGNSNGAALPIGYEVYIDGPVFGLRIAEV